jgi:hypothetical protein
MTIPTLNDDRSERVKSGVDVLQAFRNLRASEQEAIASDLMWSLRPVYEERGYMVLVWSYLDLQRIRPKWSEQKCKLFLKQFGREFKNALLQNDWETVRAFVSSNEAELESGGA